jgi:hypothetical protein
MFRYRCRELPNHPDRLGWQQVVEVSCRNDAPLSSVYDVLYSWRIM